MPIKARYAHTNIVARDWRRLAQFYQDVFGCVPVPPQRDHHGPWVADLTGLAECRVRGMHLRLPGHGEHGPTLEIFEFEPTEPHPEPAIHRQGLAHLAFEVDDVSAARAAALAAGASDLGKVLTRVVPGAGTITLVYMLDPEGNIFELQRWE